MNDNYLKDIYADLHNKYGDKMQDYEAFSKSITSDNAYRQDVYNELHSAYGDKMHSYEDFSKNIAPAPKEEPPSFLSAGTNTVHSTLPNVSKGTGAHAIPVEGHPLDDLKQEIHDIGTDIGLHPNESIGYPFEPAKSNIIQNVAEKPAQQIAQGAQEALQAVASPFSLQGQINSNKPFAEQLGHALRGTGEAAFGAIGATGEGAAFNEAMGVADKVTPNQYMSNIMSPLANVIKPETDLGKLWASVGDMGWGILMFEGAKMVGGVKAKVLDIAEKVKNNEPLTPEQTQVAADVMQNVKPEDIQLAAQRHTAIEEMPDNIPLVKKAEVAPIHAEITAKEKEIEVVEEQKKAEEAKKESARPMYKSVHDEEINRLDEQLKALDDEVKDLNDKGAEILNAPVEEANLNKEPANLTQEGVNLNSEGQSIEESPLNNESNGKEAAQAETPEQANGAEQNPQEAGVLNEQAATPVSEATPEPNATSAKDRIAELEKQIFTKKGNLKKNIPDEVKKEYSALKAALEQHTVNDFEAKSKEGKEASKAETARINKDFEERQQELSKYIPEDEQQDNAIEQKMRSGEPLTEEEVKYANDNFYKPEGHEFDKAGSLQKVKGTKNPTIPNNEIVGNGQGLPKEYAIAVVSDKKLSEKIAAFRKDLDNFKIDNNGTLQSTLPGLKETWNGAIEVLKGATHIAEGIARAIEYIKDTDFFKGLNKAQQEHILKHFEEKAQDHFEEPKESYSLKNSDTDAKRVERGLGPREEVARKSNPKTWDKVVEGIDNGFIHPEQIEKEFLDGKIKSLTDEEQLALLHRNIDLHNQKKELEDAIDKYEKENDSPNIAARQRLAEVEDALDKNEQVKYQSGTIAGRALQIRQMFAKEDFSPANREAVARRANNNQELPPEMKAKYKAIHKEYESKLAEYEEALKKSEEENKKFRAEKALKDLKDSSQRERQKARTSTAIRGLAEKVKQLKINKPGEFHASTGFDLVWDAAVEILHTTLKAGAEVTEAIEKAVGHIKNTDWYKGISNEGKVGVEKAFRDQAKELFEEKRPDFASMGYKKGRPLPDALKDAIGKMARVLSDKGGADFNDIAKQVHEDIVKDIPDLSLRKVKEAISDYGRAVNMSKAELDVRWRHLKRLGKLLLGKEDALLGKRPLRSGLQRDAVTDVERNLMREVKQIIREKGLDQKSQTSIDDAWKSALDSVKTRLKNRIADLQKQIDDEARFPKKEGIKYDDEATKLKAESDKLKKELDEIVPKPDKSDAEKIEQRRKGLEKRIVDLKEQIEAGKRNEKPEPVEDTPETAKLKAEAEHLKSVLDEIDPKEKSTLTDEQRVSRALKTYKTLISNYEDYIAEKVYERPKGVKTPETPEVLAAREKLKSAKEDYNKMLEDAGVAEKRRIQAYKDRLDELASGYEERIKNGDFSKTAKRDYSKLYDKELFEKQKRLDAVRDKYRALDRQLGKQNRGKWAKAGDWIVNYSRNAKLANLTVIPKLLAAGTENVAMSYIEDIVGTGIGKIVPKLSEGNIEAKSNFRDIGKEYGAVMESLLSSKTWEVLKTGKSDIDVHGKKVTLPEEAVNLISNLHKALKDPFRKAAFHSAYEKYVSIYAEKGFDINHPQIQEEIAGLALGKANRRIFMQDNAATQAYKTLLTIMQKKGGMSAAGARVMQYLLPIVKVPTNIANVSGQYIAGNPAVLARMAYMLKDGIENTSMAEKETFMRLAKRQTVGIAMAFFAYNNPQIFGGFYHEGQKRKAGDLDAMDTKIGNVKLYHWLQDNPAFLTLQFWADLRRQNDAIRHKGQSLGLFDALVANPSKSGVRLLTNVPFVNETMQVADLLNDFKNAPQFFSNMALGEIPAGSDLRKLAQAMDKNANGTKVERKPKTFMQYLEMDMPGLRKTVPKKPIHVK